MKRVYYPFGRRQPDVESITLPRPAPRMPEVPQKESVCGGLAYPRHC